MSFHNTQSEQIITPAQAAKLLTISPTTLRHWAKVGRVNAITTLGGHRRFYRHEIEQLLTNKNNNCTINKALIIDDQVLHAELIDEFFEHFFPNMRTAIALNGFDAADMVHRLNPDLIILDLKMPGLDGFEICKRLKSGANTKYIPVIAITGYDTKDNHRKIIELGAEFCFSKPINVGELKFAIDMLSEHSPNIGK